MRSYTTTISFILPVDEMQKMVNIYCPFKPNKIILKNSTFETQSTNGNRMWLFSCNSLLSGFNSRIVTSLHRDFKFQNHDLVFYNEKDVNGSHLFQFEGLEQNIHNAKAYISMTFVFTD